jgi:hypothetical protein
MRLPVLKLDVRDERHWFFGVVAHPAWFMLPVIVLVGTVIYALV